MIDVSNPSDMRGPRLFLFLSSLLVGCGTVRESRVIALDDVAPAESMWRPVGDPPEPLLVDKAHVFYHTLKTAVSVEPLLEQYVRNVLESEFQIELDSLRVDFVGFRYAFHFPSRQDDFVLRVELLSKAGSISGEFEGVVLGTEIFHHHDLFGPDWESEIPDTRPAGAPNIDDDVDARFELVADHRAYKLRLLIRLATLRLGANAAHKLRGHY